MEFGNWRAGRAPGQGCRSLSLQRLRRRAGGDQGSSLRGLRHIPGTGHSDSSPELRWHYPGPAAA